MNEQHDAPLWQTDDGHYHIRCDICGYEWEWWFDGPRMQRQEHNPGNPEAQHFGVQSDVPGMTLSVSLTATAEQEPLELPEAFAEWAEEHGVG